MTTIVERDSSGPATLLVMFFILILIAGGVWVAYTHGVFGEKTIVIENNKTVENNNRTVENRTVVEPVQTPAPDPTRDFEKRDSEKPAETRAR